MRRNWSSARPPPWRDRRAERSGIAQRRGFQRADISRPDPRRESARVFAIRYCGGSRATFTLWGDDEGGTDLHLADDGVSDIDRADVLADWVSVLLVLKAQVDHGVDVRNLMAMTRSFNAHMARPRTSAPTSG